MKTFKNYRTAKHLSIQLVDSLKNTIKTSEFSAVTNQDSLRKFSVSV